jgi:hypothetical protein
MRCKTFNINFSVLLKYDYSKIFFSLNSRVMDENHDTRRGSSPCTESGGEAGRMASAEREPITGVWGPCLQWGPGAKPQVGGQEVKPPEADEVFSVKWVIL